MRRVLDQLRELGHDKAEEKKHDDGPDGQQDRRIDRGSDETTAQRA